MTSALIAATLAVVGYSLWVRRDTWWSRWEIGVSVALALEGVALILLSPWGATIIGPALHRIVGLWNVQDLLGCLCIVVAVSANIYHTMVRLTDPQQVRALMRRQLRIPVRCGIVAMVVLFAIADEHSLSDGLAAGGTGGWFAAYWAATGGVLLLLCGYATRVLLPLKADPRATETYRLYLTSSTFAIAAIVLQLASVWAALEAAQVAVWACVCLSIAVFAFGSARSWRAKADWFSPAHQDH